MIVEHRLTAAGSNQGPPQAASEAPCLAALARAARRRPENGFARGGNPDRIVRADSGARAHIPFSNRKIQLLESRSTHCKQTTATVSNREFCDPTRIAIPPALTKEGSDRREPRFLCPGWICETRDLSSRLYSPLATHHSPLRLLPATAFRVETCGTC